VDTLLAEPACLGVHARLVLISSVFSDVPNCSFFFLAAISEHVMRTQLAFDSFLASLNP
jgi:hypothetical protein